MLNRQKNDQEYIDPEGSGDGTHASKEVDDEEDKSDTISDIPRQYGRGRGRNPKNELNQI